MLLSVSDLVNTLRTEVNVTNSSAGLMDEGLLDMTDEQIVTLIKLGATRLDTDAESLEELMEEGNYEYPLLLLAKMELFTTLATLSARLVDMNADSNNSLKLGQRFNHYNALWQAAKDDFDKWNEDNSAEEGGNGGVVKSYDVLLSKRYMSLRNYQLQASPRVRMRIRNVTEDSAEVSWTVTDFDHFGVYRLYIGTQPCIDAYLEGGKASSKVTDSAKLLRSTLDIHDNKARIKGLIPSTLYYVAVVSIERNGVYGYAQNYFQTDAEEEESEDE